jgi:uncharacterized protein
MPFILTSRAPLSLLLAPAFLYKQNRPSTHDLMRNMVEAMGYSVSKVCITSLVGSTYHARVHLCRGRGPSDPGFAEADVDARPSDAINVALRFGAPIYVNRELAAHVARPAPQHQQQRGSGVGQPDHTPAARGAAAEWAREVYRSCSEAVSRHQDPVIMHKLHMQLAVEQQRYEDAMRLRDEIDHIYTSDPASRLIVAIEAALKDGRLEEAMKLRDELNGLPMEEKKEA